MEHALKDIQAVEFHDTFVSDLEKLQAIEQAQNQAPLDIVAEFKKLNEHLAESDRESARRDRKNFIIAALTLMATVVIGVISIAISLHR